MPQTLYLVDAYAQIFRAYYAIRGGMRSPSTGEPIQAVYGFTGMLLKLLAQFKADYIVVAMEDFYSTFRDEHFPDYKATRNPTPEDLLAQVPRILEVTRLMGIQIVHVPGLEADDVIGCIVRQVEADSSTADVHIRIVARDKDMHQLLSERVAMFDFSTEEVFGPAELMAKRGIRPDQVVDLLALVGDSVDNIPGVQGIGHKTASDLIRRYGSIDGILANLHELPVRHRDNCENARSTIPLTQWLLTLKCDVDVGFTLEAARPSPPDIEKLIPLFEELGFVRFVAEVRALMNPALGLFES